jgi:hypothetical protein
VLPQLSGHGTSIPWPSLIVTLAAVFLMGLATGWLAVRAAVETPMLEALRQDS